jgi:two-component system, OmpR family, alkaline phosphatase synthesis response regulator PhoP
MGGLGAKHRDRLLQSCYRQRTHMSPVRSARAMDGSVLVVDDDPKILELVRVYLQRAGYVVWTAADGEDALRKIEAHRPSLMVLDVMLPNVDGLVLARHLRDERDNLPILMMSALGTVSDRITGLVQGADDYLAKPFSPAELVARVNALMRRSSPGALPTETLHHGDLQIDLERREVLRAGQPVALSDLEFRLVVTLIRANGRVLSREQLVESVYGLGEDVTGRAIDVTIKRIRAKLGDDVGAPRYISTVRGAGYRAATQPKA